MTDSLFGWYERFISERLGLRVPDGRPIYAYRLDNDGFEELESALREKIGAAFWSGIASEQNHLFAALFVFYAAEWWRRHYRGGRWKWEPILNDLNIKAWPATKRGDCIERGLRYWGKRLIHGQGHTYFGAIARQAGLPNHLLATNSGAVGKVLRGVIRQGRGGSYSTDILRGWVESLGHCLPASYQGDEIIDLLAKVAHTTLKLAGSVPENQKAIDWLNQCQPGWRERFPFPMDDQALQGLLGELVQDAASRPATSSTDKPFCMERHLEPKEEGIWVLLSSPSLPERVATDALRELFSIGQQSLPYEMTLTLHAGRAVTEIRLERLAGQGAYRLKHRIPRCVGEDAVGEHVISLNTAAGDGWKALPRRGSALDPALPWVFAEDGSLWRWVRQGGGGVASGSAIIAVPGNWAVSGGQSELMGFLEVPERDIYKATGQVQICSSQGQTWIVRTNDEAATESDWRWQGQPVWEQFLAPALGFRGRPTLYDGNSRKAVNWRSRGQEAPLGVYGPLEACAQDYRARLVILPEAARVDIQSHSLSEGVIRLVGWGAVGATLDSPEPGLRIKAQQEAGTLSVIASFDGAEPTRHPPEWVRLRLVWPNNPQSATLRFPFPGQGVRVFDGEGGEILNDSWLPIHRLAGVRCVAVGLERLELRFTLRYPKEPLRNGSESRHGIRRPQSAVRIGIRLQDFADILERLLASEDVLDAWIEASVSSNHHDQFKLRLSRYLCPLERAHPNVALAWAGLRQVDAECLKRLPVLALRLESPGNEPVRLEPCRSEGFCTGAWSFVTAKREAGSWLIYPGPDAEERFRSTLWTLPGEQVLENRLSQALAVSDRQARAQALDVIVAELSHDYLHANWADVERLACHLGHLPLAAFDLWRRFAHSPAAMVALALRLNSLPDGFLRRFSVELPFAWELVPYQAWRKAAECLKAQCVAWFGEPLAAREVSKALESGLGRMREERPALSKLFGILQAHALGSPCKEVAMMSLPDSAPIFAAQLFAGDDSALQRLLREPPGQDWPNNQALFNLIETEKRANRQSVSLFKLIGDSRDGVINIPILLAIHAATGRVDEWFAQPGRIYWLRVYRDFAPEWFDEAYDLTIARCLSLGLLQA